MNNNSLLRDNIRNILTEPSFATTLHAIALLSLDPDFLYSPTTEFIEIFADLQDLYNVEIHAVNKQKLQAILTAVTTDNYFSEPSVFIAVSNTLMHGDPMFDIHDDLTIIEILWSLYEISVNFENFEDIPMQLSVQQLIEDEIAEEREDLETITDVLEEEYYIKFLIENRIKLHQELILIFPDLKLTELPEIDFSNV